VGDAREEYVGDVHKVNLVFGVLESDGVLQGYLVVTFMKYTFGVVPEDKAGATSALVFHSSSSIFVRIKKFSSRC
jgi:hypothetical protein